MNRTEPHTRSLASTGAALRLIDSDVHPHFRNALNDLAPYLPLPWRKRLRLDQELQQWSSALPASRHALPKNELYLPTPGAIRRDAAAAPGDVPGSDPAFVAEHLLDRHGIDRAVLIGGNVLGVSSLPDPELAATVASAYNDWMCEVWLAADRRYRGAALVPANHPAAAAAEIRRVASRPGMVAVMMPLADVLMGEQSFHIVYDAAQEAGLPVLVHLTGTESIFVKAPHFPGGPPTYYVEWHTGVTTVYQANVTSLIAHGVFEKFPGLKVGVIEGGVAWLLELIWRFDKDWAALRDEVPWLRRPPSEYLREHVKLTVQPMPEPARPQDFADFVRLTGSANMLMFSSDYPHWDFDNPAASLKDVDGGLRRLIEVENAAEFYGDRLLAN